MPSDIEGVTKALADKYAIERELGRGGMATVYLAHDRKHNRPVAIKVLHPEIAVIVGAERFVQEIEVTANLLLNGRQDEEHPWYTRALPLWNLLREPKELVLVDGAGHIPSLEARIPAIVEFLDTHLSPVRR